MPVAALFAPLQVVARRKRALYLAPSQLPAATQASIARLAGGSGNRLRITQQHMLDNFAEENISAVGFVWCGCAAWTFGCLQYFDWLETGQPQMWLTDLCRQGPKPARRSPVAELLDMFDKCLLSHGIQVMYLMLDSTSAPTLKRVYETYGFEETAAAALLGCVVMKRLVPGAAQLQAVLHASASSPL